jgi:uncharacterized FAD-dependent dehydrogenase
VASNRYDVVIVGAGPAGIFSALELARAGVGRILMVEKGHAIEKRHCPARQRACVGCPVCDIMTGWGGAGAFSDGKLTLTTEVGGWLSDYVDTSVLEDLIRYSDGLWLEFGATPEVHGPDSATADALSKEAARAGMRLVPMAIRHLGTERSPIVLEAMRVHLAEKGVEIRTETAATASLPKRRPSDRCQLADGTLAETRAIAAAPGREEPTGSPSRPNRWA